MFIEIRKHWMVKAEDINNIHLATTFCTPSGTVAPYEHYSIKFYLTNGEVHKYNNHNYGELEKAEKDFQQIKEMLNKGM